jgi:hypothetical protein
MSSKGADVQKDLKGDANSSVLFRMWAGLRMLRLLARIQSRIPRRSRRSQQPSNNSKSLQNQPWH